MVRICHDCDLFSYEVQKPFGAEEGTHSTQSGKSQSIVGGLCKSSFYLCDFNPDIDCLASFRDFFKSQ